MVPSVRTSSTGFMSYPSIFRPLRERKEDIPLLAEHFLKEISQRMKKEIKGISAMAMQKLMLYDWPGNVRELENTIEHAVAITQHDIISEEIILPAKDLPVRTVKTP